MKQALAFIVLLLAQVSIAQPNCYWKGNEYVSATLAIAGWVEDSVYSEFVLYECGKDTVVDMWWALEPCTIDYTGDTLYIAELAYLPSADTLDWQPWLVNSYYYTAEGLNAMQHFETDHLFEADEIAQTLKQYDTTVIKRKIEAGLFDNLMILATRLAIAEMSGSKEAAVLYQQLKEMIQPDGAIAEWYNELEGVKEGYINQ